MNKRSTTFNEQYSVTIRYQKPDGFWTTETLPIAVEVYHGINEKNNHVRAGQLAKNMFPKAEIIKIVYV